MRTTVWLCATAAAIVLVGGLTSQAAAAESDQPMEPIAAFHQIVAKLIQARKDEDAAALTALFTRNAMLLPPGEAQPIEGQENIRHFLDRYVKQKLENHKVKSQELLQGGTRTLVDVGTWSGDVPAQNGAQGAHVEGTYLAVGVLLDGQWKLWTTAWQVVPANSTAAVGSSTPPQHGASTPNK